MATNTDLCLQTITCSELKTEATQKGAEYVQS